MPELPPDLRQFVTKGREDRHLEYKEAVDWPPRGGRALTSDQAKLVKNCLGMPNVKDGGVLVVGVGDDGSLLGLTEQQASAFTQDGVQTVVNNYADPFVELTITCGYLPGDSTKWYVVFEIMEFRTYPVICQRDGTDIEKGAIYTRSYGRNETAKVREGAAMREIIDLATKKGVDRELSEYERRRAVQGGESAPATRGRFAAERGDL